MSSDVYHQKVSARQTEYLATELTIRELRGGKDHRCDLG